MKAQAGILESDPEEQAEQKLHHAVEELLPDAEDARWVERHLRPLAGLEMEETGLDDRRSEAFAAWRRFLEAIAEQGPLVLVFEDLHWADEALLDFVDHLVEWASDVPILVLATSRPELLARREGWAGGKLNATTIHLSPLSAQETAELVHTLLGRSAIAADLQARLLEHAGGNPLYAEEFARMVSQRAGDLLPETVQGIIAARLDELPREEKELLQEAAVVGRVFWLGALGGERWTLEERLHLLERREFVRRERRSSVAGEAEYVFRHALVRDVAYEQIPRARRSDMHQAAADWIESLGRREDHSEMLAHHYLQALEYSRAAGQPVVEELEVRARVALRDAGDRAAALSAFDAAARFYERALELSSLEEPGWPELSVAYARVLVTFPDHAFETMERVRTQLVAAREHAAAAEVAAMVSVAEKHRGNPERSFALMREALAQLESAPPSRPKVAVIGELARLLVLGGRGDEGIPLARQAAAMAEELGLLDLQARALTTLGAAKVPSGDLSGFEDLEQSLRLAERANSPRDVVRAYNNLWELSWTVGNVQRGENYLRTGIEVAESRGVAPYIRFMRGNKPRFD